jgi:hypothetical protein
MPEAPDDDKRRSKRFPVSIPVLASWHEPDGKAVQQRAQAREASTHGAIVEMVKYPSAGTEVTLQHTQSHRTATARVVRVEGNAPPFQVVMELLRGDEKFWGLNFQLKKAAADLFDLERAMMSGNLDSTVLREFRDAVDYVRKAAWAVQEWQDRQSKNHDTSTVLPMLMFERIRRATQLCKTISTDLQEYPARSHSQGIAELFAAIDTLRAQLINEELRGRGSDGGKLANSADL